MFTLGFWMDYLLYFYCVVMLIVFSEFNSS